jgi:hypothetical protein
VVNGSQTLHSIRDVPNPSANARVMVRVIEIEPPRGDAIEEKIQRRKEVINKIARRSNQQNPIKAWDLASNDDFQLEVFRFFRSKGYFYERRDREWRQRSRELKNVNIRFGNSIKRLTQLIASYYWSKPKLGPAVAKNVADLFEGAVYDAICETPPELAFQINLLDADLWECERDLAKEKVYIGKLKTYAHFAIFALAVRALQEAGAAFGDPAFTEQLQAQWQDWQIPYRLWKGLTKACIDHMLEAFKKEATRSWREASDELTYANYFKSQGYLTRLLERPLCGEIKGRARTLIKA